MELVFKKISTEEKKSILKLVVQMNSSIPYSKIEERFDEIFKRTNLVCFGLFENDILVGVSHAWETFHYYCGKRLEIDNFIIDKGCRSKGYGNYFIKKIELYAKENGFESIELNSYVENDRSHKFYFNEEYKILGFHFQKKSFN